MSPSQLALFFIIGGGFGMETKDYLTNYYETRDEEGRLGSKTGMVE